MDDSTGREIERERVVIECEKISLASPCINVCQMDDLSGLCCGCFRTLEEITAWSRAADDDKLAILVAASRRRTEHDFRGDCDR